MEGNIYMKGLKFLGRVRWIEPAYMAELYVGGWEGGVLMGGHAVGG